MLFGVVAALTIGSLGPAAAHEPSPYRDLDRSVVARNILPPGQGRYLNTLETVVSQVAGEQPEMNTDQLDMYEDLIERSPGLTDADVTELFKDGSFGTDAPQRTYAPRSDVVVVRDDYDVPHIYGATRGGTMFGAGYVTGEDRLFMIDTLRAVARGRLSEFLGASEANLASDRAARMGADYTEDELWHMGLRLLELDGELAYLALQDLQHFSAGINAYIKEALLDPTKLPVEYPALQVLPKPWTPTDSIALSTLIGAQFSEGGGGQLANDRFLDALEAEHSTTDAREIFDDFRNADDPESPTATNRTFHYNDTLPAADPAAVARPDDPAALASALDKAKFPATIDGPFGPIRLGFESGSSNALLVSGKLSDTGRPLAVFGPQVGYYSPQILMEVDLHGPGIHARGATFPGISLYVLLGRGTDYAWSATTARGDHIDIRAFKLCEPDGSEPTLTSTHYLADGTCTQMYRRTDTWLAKPSAAGIPVDTDTGEPSEQPIVVSFTTERTHLGIVAARGTVEGDPVAFVRERSSYFREVDATLSFVALHDPDRIDDIVDLAHAFGDYFSFSFNWHLVTAEDVGFYTTGRYPVLAPGVDPDLPYWGDSAWDPVRYLDFDEHPHDVIGPNGPRMGGDNAAGYILNWNNKQAKHFRAADDNHSYGSVHRVQRLFDEVEAAKADDDLVSMTELVRAMGLAATQDVRGRYALPLVLEVIGTPSDPDLAAAVDELAAWASAGGHRRDLDGDRHYEDVRAVAIMDRLWDPLLEAMFEPELGAAFSLVPEPRNDPPGRGGSAFYQGWYSYVSKDLRTLLGHAVDGPYSRTYCGAGVLADCRAALTDVLADAVAAADADIAADPDGFATAQWERDAIGFSAVGLQEQRLTAWQDRPTWQQVLSFE